MMSTLEPAPVKYLAARAGVRVRTGPAEGADDVMLVAYGTRFNVLGQFGDWARVTRRSPQRVAVLPENRRALGWVPSSLLADAPPPRMTRSGRVNAPGGLDVHIDPSVGGRRVGILGHGTTVTVSTVAGPWARIEAPVPGWIPRMFLQAP